MIGRAVVGTVVSMLALAGPVRTQDGSDGLAPESVVTAAPVPFGPGERLVYRTTLSPFGTVGSGSFSVVKLENVHGHPTYHLRFDLKASVLFARVDDRMQSWVDVSQLFARRFQQDQKELRYERHRTLEFFPERGRYEQVGAPDQGGELATDRPIDDVSFIYIARTLPLVVGETYTLRRYYKEEGNPIVLKAVRKETVKVPAGTFETIVVQPTIRTKGLFGQGGKAELFFSDDERRLLVQMKSNVPVLGSLNLHLESYTLGERLAPASPPAAAASR